MRLSRQLGLFAVGGFGGLLIDATIVQCLVGLAHWNPYLARVFSFLAAATFTWWWNRRYTFASQPSGRAAHAEWMRWVALMSLGALFNYGVFAALLWHFSWLHRWPAVAAAGGSVVAAGVNFIMARKMLFSGSGSAP